MASRTAPPRSSAGKSGNYDLVLLDVMLPKASGLDVCREIRKQSASTPIVIVSALSQEDQILEGFDSGASDYVTKPVSYRILTTRMRNLLQRETGREVVDSITRCAVRRPVGGPGGVRGPQSG